RLEALESTAGAKLDDLKETPRPQAVHRCLPGDPPGRRVGPSLDRRPAPPAGGVDLAPAPPAGGRPGPPRAGPGQPPGQRRPIHAARGPFRSWGAIPSVLVAPTIDKSQRRAITSDTGGEDLTGRAGPGAAGREEGPWRPR